MPNWCEGNIRFRGNIDDVIKLLSENILVCRFSDETDENGRITTLTSKPIVDVTKDSEGDVEEIALSTNNSKSWFYINGTHRNFIDEDGCSVDTCDVFKLDDGQYIIIFSGFKAAWSIESAPYVEMSEKYNVDIHIFGWERGMEFDQEIEIINGNLIKDKVSNGKNWLWEASMPYLGG